MQTVLLAAMTRGNPSGIRRVLPLGQDQGTINQRKLRRLTAGRVLTFRWQPQGKAEQFSSDSVHGY